MRRFLLALALCGLSWPAAAQYVVTTACGTPPATLSAGQRVEGFVDLTGTLCTNSSGGGGGSVTQGTSPWVISGNLTNISGTISLPTGASTAALQSTGNSTLTTINTTLGAPLQEAGSVVPYTPKASWVRGAASTTGTGATTIIASAGGSLKNYITSLQCYRSDTGTGAITVTFNDSATTIIVLPAAGANFAGSGSNVVFPVPLATAAATAFTFAPGTGTTTVYCDAQGFTGT